MDMTVLNKSGEPFPTARKVTPARFSGMFSTLAIVWRFGVKKSLAAIPMVEKSRPNQITRRGNPTTLAYPKAQ